MLAAIHNRQHDGAQVASVRSRTPLQPRQHVHIARQQPGRPGRPCNSRVGPRTIRRPDGGTAPRPCEARADRCRGEPAKPGPPPSLQFRRRNSSPSCSRWLPPRSPRGIFRRRILALQPGRRRLWRGGRRRRERRCGRASMFSRVAFRVRFRRCYDGNAGRLWFRLPAGIGLPADSVVASARCCDWADTPLLQRDVLSGWALHSRPGESNLPTCLDLSARYPRATVASGWCARLAAISTTRTRGSSSGRSSATAIWY